jgi:hypothetical protein
VDTKISNFPTNLESSLIRVISNPDSKFVSKISALESKMDSRSDSRFEILGNDVRHIVVEFKAELGKQMVELKMEMRERETRLVWRSSFL